LVAAAQYREYSSYSWVRKARCPWVVACQCLTSCADLAAGAQELEAAGGIGASRGCVWHTRLCGTNGVSVADSSRLLCSAAGEVDPGASEEHLRKGCTNLEENYPQIIYLGRPDRFYFLFSVSMFVISTRSQVD
jgi:hypothetical protein